MKYVSFTLVGLIMSLAISSFIYAFPKAEIAPASKSETTTQILGAQDEIEVSDRNYRQEIAYWQKIVSQKPSYYDGWVRLLYLGYATKNAQLQQTSWQEMQKNSLFNEADVPEYVKPQVVIAE